MDLGFSWITEILNSGHEKRLRYMMVGPVVKSLGKHCYPWGMDVKPTWIPPLLGALSLSERFRKSIGGPCSGSIVLSILSTSQASAGFAADALPLLSSTLLSTHPLQSRRLALKVFCTLMPGWFSSQMDSVISADLDRLLQAVGDPFQSTPDPLSLDWRFKRDYEPFNSVVILIEFASSDLWRNHLRRSNFTSCEEFLSTEDKKRNLLGCMLFTVNRTWPTFLHTPAKIVAAIRRLEELQCSNTAEVVIMWAWTAGLINTMDHDGWKLVGGNTFRFYQTHGIGRLAVLKRSIINKNGGLYQLRLLRQRYGDSPYRTRRTKRDIPSEMAHMDQDEIDLAVSRVCQLRRLYHLFGHGPTMWREAVVTEGMVVVEEAVASEVDEEMDVSPGRLVTPVPFVDWACDYP